LKIFVYYLPAFRRAENDVLVVLGKGMGHECRASGALIYINTFPSASALGYLCVALTRSLLFDYSNLYLLGIYGARGLRGRAWNKKILLS